jgi:hypothetical protein
MRPNGHDPRPAGGATAPALDPQALELLRTTLAALAAQKTAAADEVAEAAAEPKPPAPWLGPLLATVWSAVPPFFVTGLAVLGLFAYRSLGRDVGENRKEASALRRQLGEFGPEFVRKDEFNNRNLAIQALILEPEAKSAAALASVRDRFGEQKKVERELSESLKELRLEAAQVARRLEKLEPARPAAPAPVAQGKPKGQ